MTPNKHTDNYNFSPVADQWSIGETNFKLAIPEIIFCMVICLTILNVSTLALPQLLSFSTTLKQSIHLLVDNG